jgi:hypothetical protein
MTDPAVEAAQRVRDKHPYCLNDHHADSCLTDAAREALKPIREVYEHFDEYSRGPGDYRAGVRTVLDQLAPLIYSTEELST